MKLTTNQKNFIAGMIHLWEAEKWLYIVFPVIVEGFNNSSVFQNVLQDVYMNFERELASSLNFRGCWFKSMNLLFWSRLLIILTRTAESLKIGSNATKHFQTYIVVFLIIFFCLFFYNLTLKKVFFNFLMFWVFPLLRGLFSGAEGGGTLSCSGLLALKTLLLWSMELRSQAQQ